MTEKQKLILKIWQDPNGAHILDEESESGYCSTEYLIECYPEEKEFIKTLPIISRLLKRNNVH